MTVQSRPKYTDEQAAAIETRGVSIALSAGAGCGKTFVLTQRFLAGLEPGSEANSLHSLVAITFTERAAREMRDRIRSACQQRLMDYETTNVDHWLNILRGLDSARISTIHSFCTSLLRSHAVEAGLDPRFTVLEPAIADTLLRNTARQTLHRLLEQADADADEFVLKFGLERSQDLLQRLTRQRFQIVFGNFENQTTNSVAQAWRTHWQTVCIPRLMTKFRDSPIAKQTAELLSEHEPTHAEMRARRSTLLSWLDPSCAWDAPLHVLAEIEKVARVQGGGNADSWPSADAYDAVKNTLKALREGVRKLQEELPIDERDLQLAAEFSVRALRLTRLTADAYESAKQSQGLLDFDDLLLRARDLLQSGAQVRDRVASSIRLLMVDEFQDTDPVQAEIVQMLCGDALIRGRLFLVGDAKQSIYRFRRADPGVFARLRQQIPQAGQLPLSTNFRSQPAVLNFVNHLFAAGMKDSYEPLKPAEDKQISPTPAIEFLFATFDAKDPVRETDAAASDSQDVDPADSDAPRGSVPASQLRKREADWIARRCAELLSDTKRRIRNKDADGKPPLRRVEAGDIVVLFRALSNIKDYEAAFLRYDLDYYLVGGKSFFSQQEVFDLLNLCRYLDDQDDLIGLVGVLRSPFFNLSDDSIQALVTSSVAKETSDAGVPLSTGVPLAAALSHQCSGSNLHDRLMRDPPSHLSEEQRWRIANARSVLTELRALKDRLPLAKLLTMAVERTGYDAALLTEHLGARKVANLRKLIDMAAEFDQSELFTLKDFVQRLQTSVLEETDEEFATTLPETGKVIRLMSIHQAKGLEFPVVIVADIDRKGPPRSKSAVLHPELGALVRLPDAFGETYQNLGLKIFDLAESDADAEETIRLFYVACTRAADYLILSAGVDTSSVKKRSPWWQLVESRFDIRTGLPKTDALLGSSTAKTAGRQKIPKIFPHSGPPQVKPVFGGTKREIPFQQLIEQIRKATPGEIPSLARRIPRDASDLPPLSVSRLETIDAERLGIAHVQSDRNLDFEDAVVDVDQATQLGTLVHAVLERVEFGWPEEWPSILETAVSSSRDHVNDETVASARTLIGRLIDSPIAGELARAKSLHREVEFVLRWPANGVRPVLIRGIIDLLYEDEAGGWHILDYKTNDFPRRASDEQLLAPYEFQLAVYAHAVTEWLGEPPRELALIALRPSVRRISLAWSAERWQKLEARIQATIERCRAN